MEQIGNDLRLKIKVTTQYARHSFATVLKRANVSSEMISEMLGHSNLNTTKHYLASFEAEAIHSATDVLTFDFVKQAN
jgi:site-specific recombinase XerD